MAASAHRVIVNPAAGGGRAGALAETVQESLRRQGGDVALERTSSSEHAREVAGIAARAGEIAVVVGGDGMVGIVADALRAVPGAVMGIVPAGRGNDLARALGIPANPADACAVIAGGEPVAIDLGEAGGRAFVGIASLGFDSEANRIANAAPPRLGQLVYAYGALRALARWRSARFEVSLDGGAGGSFSFSGYTVAAANSSTYGGGMLMAPGARLDDGLLDVVMVGHVSRLRFLANLPRVFRGTHVELPEVQVHRAAEVEISADRPFEVYADGDPLASLPVTVRALPGAVRVLLAAGSRP